MITLSQPNLFNVCKVLSAMKKMRPRSWKKHGLATQPGNGCLVQWVGIAAEKIEVATLADEVEVIRRLSEEAAHFPWWKGSLVVFNDDYRTKFQHIQGIIFRTLLHARKELNQ